MTSRIKNLGLALMALTATSLTLAGSAHATQLHASAEGQQYVLHGNQTEQVVVTTTAGTIKCTQITFEGTIVPTADGTLTPTFTGCQALGQAATIDVNGCKFTATGKDTSGVTYGNKTVNVDITGCTAGKSIEITTGICRLTLPEQHHVSHIVFSNNTGQPDDLNANLTLSAMKYQADGPLCPNMATGQTLTNGTVVGKATFQAYAIAGTTQVTKHGHQYNEHTRGAALGLLVT